MAGRSPALDLPHKYGHNPTLFRQEISAWFARYFDDYRFQSAGSSRLVLSESPLLLGGADVAAAGGLLSIPFLPSALSTICKTAPIMGRIINTAMKTAQKGCSFRN
jgi:hypothetical protein